MILKKALFVTLGALPMLLAAQVPEKLIYHEIRTDASGKIIPWYNPDPGTSYDHVIRLVFDFWNHMRTDYNGLPYYMNHQVWKPDFDDPRGIGGDQFAMALSSWRLLYAYTGNEQVKANMFFIADYYMSHGFSSPDAQWPNLPYPYNTLVNSGIYDGDMRNGRDVLQPDKAGSFGYELLNLYKMSNGYNTGLNGNYLEAAIRIANTLAVHITPGDSNHSPLPFKVNARTGEPALLRSHDFTGTWIDTACYTSNWSATLQLFWDLSAMGKGDTAAYRKGFRIFLDWMKTYPLALNKWGPFFEDVDWWSETQINAMTFARFIMEHRDYFTDWKKDVSGILDWVHKNFGNHTWKKYGVMVTNEQTVYPMPANSHSSRQAADELLYVHLSGDSTLYDNAVRELNWATYMVDVDGKNRFPGDENWLTDGYGDYVRHYLRAMDAIPVLSPCQDHILSSTSVIQQADYAGHLLKFYGLNFEKADSNKVRLYYRTFDEKGVERIRLVKKPSGVWFDGKAGLEGPSGEGYSWTPLKKGGLLTVRRGKAREILIWK